MSELLAYDKAIKTVLDFAKADGNTLVISVADHTTGSYPYLVDTLIFTFPEINWRLFVEASAAFQIANFSTTIDRTDPTDRVSVVSRGQVIARLPLVKNLVLMNGKTLELAGIVVLAERLDKVFLPSQAIDVVQAELKE